MAILSSPTSMAGTSDPPFPTFPLPLRALGILLKRHAPTDISVSTCRAREKRESQLRGARQLARKLFDLADTDRSGYLDRKEAKRVQERLEARCPEIQLDPPFDEEADFAIMDKDQMGTVSWDEFETWWMARTGDAEPSCPVSCVS